MLMRVWFKIMSLVAKRLLSLFCAGCYVELLSLGFYEEPCFPLEGPHMFTHLPLVSGGDNQHLHLAVRSAPRPALRTWSLACCISQETKHVPWASWLGGTLGPVTFAVEIWLQDRFQ